MTSSTLVPQPNWEHKTCILWGDPHCYMFDGMRVDYYGPGEVWIVNSAQVHIKGIFDSTPWTVEHEEGKSATMSIIVTGPILEGHTIEVGRLGEPIIWNGKPILEPMPWAQVLRDGLGIIRYSSEGKLIDPTRAVGGIQHVVRMHLPSEVLIEVFRYNDAVDVRISMPQALEQQTGMCGDFNGVIHDDNWVFLETLTAPQLAEHKRLFSSDFRTPRLRGLSAPSGHL